MGWGSIFKTVACLICGGGLVGLLRGSVGNGMLGGLILFAVLLAIALPVLVADYAGRKRARRVTASLQNREREAA